MTKKEKREKGGGGQKLTRERFVASCKTSCTGQQVSLSTMLGLETLLLLSKCEVRRVKRTFFAFSWFQEGYIKIWYIEFDFFFAKFPTG